MTLIPTFMHKPFLSIAIVIRIIFWFLALSYQFCLENATFPDTGESGFLPCCASACHGRFQSFDKICDYKCFL